MAVVMLSGKPAGLVSWWEEATECVCGITGNLVDLDA